MKRTVMLKLLALLIGMAATIGRPGVVTAAETTPVRVLMPVDRADVPKPALRYSLFQDMFDQLPGNAAVAYARANRLIAQNENWKKDTARMREWLDQPIDQLPEAEVAAMLATHAAALDQLIKATRCENCDWEIPIRQEGMSAMLPHLSELREALRLLMLETRLCIRQGRFEAAIDRLRAGLTMSRHMGEGSILIEGLVGVAMANQVLGTLEDFIRQPGSPNLYWALTDLPPSFLSIWRATLWERSCIYVQLPVLREIGQRPLTAMDLQRALIDFQNLNGGVSTRQDHAALAVLGMGWIVYPLARNGLAGAGMSTSQLDELSAADVLLRYVGGGFARQRDDLFKWFAVPYPEARKGLDRAEAEFEQAIARDPVEHTFSRLFLPAIGRAADRFAELERQFAILRSVEAIRFHAAHRDGQLPTALNSIEGLPIPPDPMTGLPFVYRLDGQTATLEPPKLDQVKSRKPRIYEITVRR